MEKQQIGEMRPDLVAPCGMDCRLCYAYQREKNHCDGCRNELDITYKTKGRNSCAIKNCTVIQGSTSGFCFECDRFPCQRLKQLDKRYRTKYHMSMIENLQMIEQNGMDAFLRQQGQRWTCPTCGRFICVHKAACLYCKS